MALRIRYEIFEINKIRLYIERVVWDKKGVFKMISSLFGHIPASQTLFSHRKLIYKNKKKDTLGLLNHRRIKKMIYKATEPS